MDLWGHEDVGVRRLILEHYRNYRLLDLSLGPGFNVLTGKNAQGKTNILEALYLLSSTRLLRGSKDSEAILEGEQAASLKAEVQPHGSVLGLSFGIGSRKKATLNGMSLPRAADLIGRLPSVCITAEDLSLVRGEPSDRRLFFDIELSSRYPSYLRDLTVYKRALEQRNALLKQAQDQRIDASLFEPWEMELAEHGTRIRVARETLVVNLQPISAEFHQWMGERENLSLRYMAKDDGQSQAELYRLYSESRHEEIRRGATAMGPHRDDLAILIDGRDVRHYGSQGQQRTSVIAIKMATLRLAALETGSAPLLLLDDILSDLDEHRRQALTELVVRECAQAVLTCTEASAAGPAILDKAIVFKVNAGTVSMQ